MKAYDADTDRSPSRFRSSATTCPPTKTLFEDKLDIFAKLIAGQPVTWSGRTRPPLVNQHVYPPSETTPLRTWVAVGGTPASVVRAAATDCR